jgi:hypothetical protein
MALMRNLASEAGAEVVVGVLVGWSEPGREQLESSTIRISKHRKERECFSISNLSCYYTHSDSRLHFFKRQD